MMAPDTDLTDPLIWLTWLAANTSSIRLGTGILILPERNPLVLAKQLGTLDSFSGGRVELGIGVGWLKEEFDALGIPWERREAQRRQRSDQLRSTGQTSPTPGAGPPEHRRPHLERIEGS